MIVPLEKIQIIVPKDEEERVVDALQSLAMVQVIKQRRGDIPEKQSQEIESLHYRLAHVREALLFLKKTLSPKELKKTAKSLKKEISYKKIQKKMKRFPIDGVTGLIIEVETSLEQGKYKLEQIQNKISYINTEKKVPILVRKSIKRQSLTGIIKLKKYTDFISAISEKKHGIEIETLYRGFKNAYIEISCQQLNSGLLEILSAYGFKQNRSELSQESMLNILKSEERRIKKNIKKWRKKLKKLKKLLRDLYMAEDYLTSELSKLEVKETFRETRYFAFFNAWIRKDDREKLTSALKQISNHVLVSTLEKSEDDEPPIVIKNHPLMAPFETITGIYGFPRYKEIDPTPYLAPFFLTFFAIALGDAGYGLLITIAALGVLMLAGLSHEKKRFFVLLTYAGVMTIIVGALFGGWFGMDLSILPESPIKELVEKIKLLDPMEDTMTFMLLAFALGFIQIWFAEIIRMAMAIRIKDSALSLASFTWIVLLSSAATWVSAEFFGLEKMAKCGAYSAAISLAALIFIEGRKTKNVFLKPFLGFAIVAQGLIRIMSDTLSYSRLVALGLATTIIAFVFNVLAGIFRDLIPYAGWIVWFIIIIGGHLFNIGINILGAFIHSARLQFVEFFPKFMQGGGAKFDPFQHEVKNYNIK